MASRLLVQAEAAEVAADTRCRLFSTERTTALLRMSALNASYQALRMTSSLSASEEPATLLDETPFQHAAAQTPQDHSSELCRTRHM